MSTNYFVLSKPKHLATNTNSANQIHYYNSDVFILPHVNINYYMQHGLFESNLIEWAKQFCKPEKIFLDIGAHTGTYSISLAPYSKEVHSFEPQKNTYYALCGSVALSGYSDKIQCHNIGLGSQEQVGKQTLNIVSNDGGGSTLHAPSNVLRQETIHINTLDSLQLNDIGFIKMDVEENEIFVLEGGKETIKRSQHPAVLFESNTHDQKLFDKFIEIGYSKIIPVAGVQNMFLAVKN